MAVRSLEIKPGLSELRLSGLVVRVTDDQLGDLEWLESVASYVVEKPPKRWSDDDELHFDRELLELAGRFTRVEMARPVSFLSANAGTNFQSAYLIVTRADGVENQSHAAIADHELPQIDAISNRILDVIGILDRVAVAAIARILVARTLAADVDALPATGADSNKLAISDSDAFPPLHRMS
jgi:hypothetical protein